MRLTDVVQLVAERGARRHAEKRGGVMLPLAVGAMLPGIAERAIERGRSTERALSNAETQKVAARPSLPGLADMMSMMSGKAPPSSGRSDMSWAGRPQGGSGGMLDFRRLQQFGGFPKAKAQEPQASQPKAPSPYEGSMDMPAGLGMSLPLAALGGQASRGFADSVKNVAASPLEGVASGISGGIGESIKRMMIGREFGERKDPMHLGGTAAIQTLGKGLGEMGVDLLRDMADKAMSAVGHAGDASAREAILNNLKRTDPVLSSADDKTLMEAYHTMSRFAPVLSTDKNAVRSFLRQAVMSGSGPDYMSIKLLADSERAVTGGNEKRGSIDWASLGRSALIPAAAGGIAGALSDKDDRLGGAARGALLGGAVGATGHALGAGAEAAYNRFKTPANQGSLPPQIGKTLPRAMGNDQVFMPHPGTSGSPGYSIGGFRSNANSESSRMMSPGAADLFRDLAQHDAHELGALADAEQRARNYAPITGAKLL